MASVVRKHNRLWIIYRDENGKQVWLKAGSDLRAASQLARWVEDVRKIGGDPRSAPQELNVPSVVNDAKGLFSVPSKVARKGEAMRQVADYEAHLRAAELHDGT